MREVPLLQLRLSKGGGQGGEGHRQEVQGVDHPNPAELERHKLQSLGDDLRRQGLPDQVLGQELSVVPLGVVGDGGGAPVLLGEQPTTEQVPAVLALEDVLAPAAGGARVRSPLLQDGPLAVPADLQGHAEVGDVLVDVPRLHPLPVHSVQHPLLSALEVEVDPSLSVIGVILLILLTGQLSQDVIEF